MIDYLRRVHAHGAVLKGASDPQFETIRVARSGRRAALDRGGEHDADHAFLLLIGHGRRLDHRPGHVEVERGQDVSTIVRSAIRAQGYMASPTR